MGAKRSTTAPRAQRRRGLAAAVVAAAALACALFLPAAAAASGGLLGITLGGESTVSVSLGATELVKLTTPVTVPEVKLTVAGTEPGAPLLGVSAAGNTIVEVPATTPATPTAPVTSEPDPVTTTTGTESPVATTTTTGTGGTSTGGAAKSSQAATAGTSVDAAGTEPASAPPKPRPGKRQPRTRERRRARRPAAARDLRGVLSSGATEPLAAARAGRDLRRPAAPARGGGDSDPLSAIGRHIPLPLPVPNWSKPIILVLALMCLWLGLRLWLGSRRARGLEVQRRSLLADIDVMQGALLPEVPDTIGGLGVSVAYRPAEGPAAGGDFYDVFPTPQGDVAIVLGDVAGHGHESLRHAALTHYTLRAYLQAGLEPRAALALAGEVLADPSGERFATVALALYDPGAATLTYALAGHPAPLVHDHTGVPGREAVEVCCSPPLGWGLPTGLRQRKIAMPAGMRVCLFSDGLIEARLGETAGEGLLERAGLADTMLRLGPSAGASELLAAVRERAFQTPDDMAACLLTADPAAAPPPCDREELELGAAALRAPHILAYLRANGLTDEHAERILRHATALIEEGGGALIVLDHQEGRIDAQVSPTPARQGRTAPGRGAALTRSTAA